LIASAPVMANYPTQPTVRAGDYADCSANEP
jgi:hypothetical protein